MGAVVCYTLLFSSGTKIKGDCVSVAITECFPRNQTNPYGQKKLVIEDMLDALRNFKPMWRIGVLLLQPRCDHLRGLIGED